MFDIRDYFGFDLGDGESAVTWLREGSSVAPMVLEIAGRKNVLSAVALTPDGQSLIGEQALIVGAQDLSVRFKSSYLNQRASASRLIKLFAARVLEEIEKSGKLSDPARSAFFIGCPSGWPPDAREAYRRLFMDAGFPNVSIVSESRAAFLFARESGELGLMDEAFTRPALVIDAGSSTTDFTFIQALEARPAVDFGENALGGGLIDRQLLDVNVRRHPLAARLAEIFADCPQYAARAELESRKVKELYFTRRMQPGLLTLRLPCESSVKIYYENPPITLDIACSDADMRSILRAKLPALNGRSYLEAYQDGLDQAKRALSATPPELIMLTGGASRMDFIAELARRAFPHARIVTGAEPEFAIARGLCYALRMDVRADRFMRDVKALIDSDAVESIVLGALPGLLRAVAPVMADELVHESAPTAFARWKRGELKVIGDIGDAIHESLAASLEQGTLKQAIEDVVRDWIEGIRPALEALTDPICARCQLPPAMLHLPAAAPEDVANFDIARVGVIDVGMLQTAVDLIVGAIVAGLAGGGGVALFMAGPVGLIVGFAVGFVASRLGTTLARKHLDKFRMPSFMRTLFPKRMFERALVARRFEIEASIAQQLAEQSAGATSSALVLDISTAIECQLTQMADDARLMIH